MAGFPLQIHLGVPGLEKFELPPAQNFLRSSSQVILQKGGNSQEVKLDHPRSFETFKTPPILWVLMVVWITEAGLCGVCV